MILLASCSFTPANRAEIPKLEKQAADLGHPVKLEQAYSPNLALGLGFAPFGIGGFYVGRPGLGISGLLWPLSIAWLPVVAENEANFRNYSQLKAEVTQLREDAVTRMLSRQAEGGAAGAPTVPNSALQPIGSP
jgi:hypothetical protein